MNAVVRRLGTPVAIVITVALMGVLWILSTPPSAGPDEPSHIVRGGALVRGQLEGEQLDEDDTTFTYFELPAEVSFPPPNCFAFQPDTPATCATSLEVPSGEAILFTRSSDYPIWGHLLPGVGTFVPGESSSLASRLLDALVPILLLGASIVLASRRSAFAVGATLLAATPMVWFTIGVVNPSGYVVAGGLGLWTALLALGRDVPPGRFTDRTIAWLAAASWTAMVLPRRDGLVYAALILSIVLLVFAPDLRRLGRAPLAVAGVATLATLVWAAGSDTTSSQALLVAPLAPLAAVGLRRAWGSATLRHRGMRIAAAGGLGLVTIVGLFVVMDRRAGGFDRAALRAAISRTGLNLRQAIGDLGWLDTPVPDTAVFVWLTALGALAGVALLEGSRRRLLIAASTVLVGIVTSWTLTMLQNDPLGTYWQGRYYLPLLVGVPIVLGTLTIDAARGRRVGVVVGGAGLIVVNVALAQMMRRFSVGTTGSLMPTDWDTYDTLLPPVVLLALHLVASAALLAGVMRLAERSERPVPTGVNVIGYHHVASGLGEIAREIHRSLLAAGVACTAIDVRATDSPRVRDPQAVTSRVHGASIAVVPALQLPSALAELPEVTAVHDRLVGYFFWELADVPESHRPALDLVDEVWTPTTFVRDAYAASVTDGVPVQLVPTRRVRPEVADDAVARWRRELANGVGSSDDASETESFVFFTSLDLFSVIERKNPVGVIDAFRAAFGDQRPNAPGEFGQGGNNVRLVVKTINGDRRPDDLAAIIDAAGGDPRIDVVDRYVDAGDLHAMIAAADCFVSLHRSEGLGLHLADAMWLGTPVIATRYSGNLDLMDDDSAALVDAELITVSDGRGAYPDASRWADPDLGQAAEWMRRLVDDRNLGPVLAQAAQERMSAQPATAEFGSAMADALGLERNAGMADAPEPAGGSENEPGVEREADASAATGLR